MVIDKEWIDMTAADVANALLNNDERDDFLIRMLKEGTEQEDANATDVTDGLVDRINPMGNLSSEQMTSDDYERFIRVILTFEKYIDRNKRDADWQYKWYRQRTFSQVAAGFAFSGIYDYMVQKKLISE